MHIHTQMHMYTPFHSQLPHPDHAIISSPSIISSICIYIILFSFCRAVEYIYVHQCLHVHSYISVCTGTQVDMWNLTQLLFHLIP